ncbi:MAG TPA: hypothetical protein VII99_12130 [Bacteroidia bacterium]
MRAKTLIELLTLSTNLYMISKDEEFMENLSEMTKKGKQKIEDLLGEFSEEGEDSEDKLIRKLLSKTKQVKEDMEKVIEEAAVRIYKKMHIAHTDQVKKLNEDIDFLKKQLALAESRIDNFEKKPS